MRPLDVSTATACYENSADWSESGALQPVLENTHFTFFFPMSKNVTSGFIINISEQLAFQTKNLAGL